MATLRLDKIQFSLEPTLVNRHGENSPRSDFQGTPFELVVLLAITFMKRLREVGRVEKFPWGKYKDTFIVKGASPENFRAIGRSFTIHGVEKPPADNVDLIVRVTRTKKGKVREVELIDFQAWPLAREDLSEIQPAA